MVERRGGEEEMREEEEDSSVEYVIGHQPFLSFPSPPSLLSSLLCSLSLSLSQACPVSTYGIAAFSLSGLTGGDWKQGVLRG